MELSDSSNFLNRASRVALSRLPEITRDKCPCVTPSAFARRTKSSRFGLPVLRTHNFICAFFPFKWEYVKQIVLLDSAVRMSRCQSRAEKLIQPNARFASGSSCLGKALAGGSGIFLITLAFH